MIPFALMNRPRDTGLLLIAAFKLAKGLLLVAAGIGALRLLHRDVAAVAAHWIAVIRVDPDNRYIHALMGKILSVNDRRLSEISAGTFFYAALFLTEGTGLALRERWAKYLTIVATASLIPLEGYEIARHVSLAKIIVIGINIAVVWYLVLKVAPYRRTTG